MEAARQQPQPERPRPDMRVRREKKGGGGGARTRNSRNSKRILNFSTKNASDGMIALRHLRAGGGCFFATKHSRERKLQPEGPTPGRKVVRLLTLARRNPACDVDKMPSPNFILTPSKDALGSYRELNPSNFLCVSVLIPKKHLSSILRKMLLRCFFGMVGTKCILRRS